jgi:hypothetical protein
MLEHHTQILTRRNFALACGLLTAVAVVTFILLSNGSGATAKASAPPPPSYAAYPALSSTKPTGLPLVTHNSSAAANANTVAATGPTFPASPPPDVVGEWPEAESIRKVSVGVPAVSAWIAKGIGGGVCVLSSRHEAIKGVYGVAVSCNPTSSAGATVESEVPGGNAVTVAGVVPAGVSSVEVALTNGTTRTVPVADNAWALETDAHIQSTHDVAGN